MRLIAFVLAAAVAGIVSGAAVAQGQWKEYGYANQGFGIAWPADPNIQEVEKFEAVPGKMVPATIYSLDYNKSLLKVTVIDGRDANLNEDAVIRHHVAKVTQGGQVTFDFPHRIYRIYGRQMSVARPNGSVTQAVFFFANERLYMVESTRMPGGEDFDLIKFQQSLTFDRNVRNRTEQQIAAIMAACKGGVAGNDRPGNPAGLDDPRCSRD
jgi:hypothetical protein